MIVQDETGAVGQASTSTRRGASVVDLNTSAALPAVVGRHREAPAIVAAARMPGQSPNGKRSPTRTPGNARLGRATLTPMASQSSTWMRVPEFSNAGRTGSPQTRMMMNVEGFFIRPDNPVDGWEIENCTTRVLRTPQDNCTQPCNISALQIRGSHVLTLAPNSFRIWELSLEDSSSSGLLFDFHPTDRRSDHASPSLNEDLLGKLRNGYAGFLQQVGEVQVDTSGAIPKNLLANSKAMQCFNLTHEEFSVVMSLVPSAYENAVTAKSLFVTLGSLMDYQDQEASLSNVTGANKPCAVSQTSWTSFDSSDSLVAAGNSAGGLIVVRIDNGCEECRFYESMHPQNGHDIPVESGSPVTVVKLAPGTVISGSLDGIIRFWDIGSKRCSWCCQGHNGPVRTMDASMYPYVASSASGQDFVPRIWNVDRFEPHAVDRALHKLEGHDGIISCLAFMTRCCIKILATGGADATVRLWRCDDGNCLVIFKQGQQAVTCLAGMGKFLVTGSRDASIQVWDVESLRSHCTLVGHHMAVTSVDAVDDRLISSSEDGYTLVWGMAALGQFRFSMDNKGVQSRKPDAPNVPEQVILQAVHGDNILTKTKFGYPTLRTFNASSPHIPRKTGPCGFMTAMPVLGGCTILDHGSPLSPAPPPNTAREAVAQCQSQSQGLTERGIIFSSNALRGPAILQQISPSIGNDRDGMLILTASQASITPESRKGRAAALHGRSLDKENFRRPFDLVDDELRDSTGPDFQVAHKLAWGRRNMTASTMTHDSRRQRLDVGLHLQEPLHGPGVKDSRKFLSHFHVAGERDHTRTDDPSYRAWKHKWMRSRGAADPRVDGAMMHASMLKNTLVQNQNFLLPLDYEQLNKIQSTSGRGGSLGVAAAQGVGNALYVNRRGMGVDLPRVHTTKAQQSRDVLSRGSNVLFLRAQTTMQ